MMRTHIRELGNKYRLEDTEINRHKQFRGEHSGLILHRLLAEQLPPEDESSQQAKEQRKRALAERQAIFHSAINASGNPEVCKLYKIAFGRWQKSLPELTATTELQTAGRLIVGLGTENVLETGITLHHTYGLPVLPGSGLKGLAAHYCDQTWGASEERFKKGGEYHRLLFGTTDENGCIIFHDGWFVPESEKEPLKLDVMTPHHPRWLDGSVPPTDFDSPTPVPFLSVTGQFLIAVSWCGPANDRSRNWTELTLSLLVDALHYWGIGGKTSSGYGRLVVPPPLPPPEPYKGKTNDVVEAVLLEEKTKRGGWRAQIKGYSQIGPIQNSDQVPADAKPGDVVRLVIAAINDRDVQFKWPPASKK